MYETEYEKQYRKLNESKWGLMILNALVFFTALVTFSITIWIRFDLNFKEYVRETGWYSYFYCTYVIMIGMVIVIVNTLSSSYGVGTDSRGWITFGSWVWPVCWLFELSGAIAICIYGIEESDTLIKQLTNVFMELVYKYDTDPRASRIMRMIQEEVGCCGANGSEDYIGVGKPVPFECRDPVMGREYGAGCAQQLAWWLEPWTATLAGICCFLMLVHVGQIVLASKLNRRLREYYDYDQAYEYED